MNNLALIMFVLIVILLILLLLVITLSIIIINKWRKAYNSLRNKYEQIKLDNLKLQRDVYRLTYSMPFKQKTNEVNENGRK